MPADVGSEPQFGVADEELTCLPRCPRDEAHSRSSRPQRGGCSRGDRPIRPRSPAGSGSTSAVRRPPASTTTARLIASVAFRVPPFCAIHVAVYISTTLCFDQSIAEFSTVQSPRGCAKAGAHSPTACLPGPHSWDPSNPSPVHPGRAIRRNRGARREIRCGRIGRPRQTVLRGVSA